MTTVPPLHPLEVLGALVLAGAVTGLNVRKQALHPSDAKLPLQLAETR